MNNDTQLNSAATFMARSGRGVDWGTILNVTLRNAKNTNLLLYYPHEFSARWHFTSSIRHVIIKNNKQREHIPN